MEASKRLQEKASVDETQGAKQVRPSDQADSSYDDLGNASSSQRLQVQQQALTASQSSNPVQTQQVAEEPTSIGSANEEQASQPRTPVSSEVQAAVATADGTGDNAALQQPIPSTSTAAAEPTPGKEAGDEGKAASQQPEPSSSASAAELSLEACVMGLPGGWSQSRLIAYLEALEVDFDLLRKRKGWTYAFIRFATPEQRAAGQAVLQQQNLGIGRLAVKNSKPAKSNKGYGKSAQSAAADLAAMDVRSVVCPLWQLPYGEQLQRKRERVEEALKRVTRQVAKRHKRNEDGPAWLKELPDKDATCAPLLGILRSPQLDGYRNKCEFSIGVGVDDQPVVGFALGSFKDGITAMAPPTGCRHISSTAMRLAATVQEFLRVHSKLPVWDKRVNKGFWRQLTVREGREQAFIPCAGQQGCTQMQSSFAELDWQQWLLPTASETDAAEVEEQAVDAPVADQVMVVVQINPEAASATAAKAECAALGAFLRQYSREGPQKPLPLSVLLLQQHSGVSNAAPEDAPLLPFPQPRQDDNLADDEGEVQQQGANRTGLPVATHISDNLGDLRFQISPAAFFQVNSGAASVLFKAAGEWAAPEPASVLLDICCGTGTIGLTLAHMVASVIGVDIVEQAIADARTNAALNGITNCRYMASRAEDVMHRLLAQASQSFTAQPASGEHGPVAQTASGDHGLAAQPASNVETTQPAQETPAGNDGSAGAAQLAGTDTQGGSRKGVQGQPQIARRQALVAIVDPPRAGLHGKVLHALLRCPALSRLVYVSCNPDTLANDMVELCSPPAGTGGASGVGWVPFRPMKALAADLFPHTHHCESLVLLER